MGTSVTTSCRSSPVARGSVIVGVPAGTHIELPFGAAFGPIIAGDDGTRFLEITDGDFRSWGDRPETFDDAIATARGHASTPTRP